MSILINMKMPKSCHECRFLEGDTMDGLYCQCRQKGFADGNKTIKEKEK